MCIEREAIDKKDEKETTELLTTSSGSISVCLRDTLWCIYVQ